MSVTTKFVVEPLPSERDWNVYQLVRVQQWSTRAVAKDFEISQTLVCQIVQRVGKFLFQSIKVPAKEQQARELAAGRQLAAERIDFLIGEALRCFRKSQSPVKSTHESSTRHCITTRTCHGDLRYLHAAARLAQIASTLPPPLVMIEADDFELTADDSAPDNHPDEDCSAPAAEQPEVTEATAEPLTATAAEMLSFVERSRAEAAPAQSAPRPVQPPRSQCDTKAERRAKFFQAG